MKIPSSSSTATQFETSSKRVREALIRPKPSLRASSIASSSSSITQRTSSRSRRPASVRKDAKYSKQRTVSSFQSVSHHVQGTYQRRNPLPERVHEDHVKRRPTQARSRSDENRSRSLRPSSQVAPLKLSARTARELTPSQRARVSTEPVQIKQPTFQRWRNHSGRRVRSVSPPWSRTSSASNAVMTSVKEKGIALPDGIIAAAVPMPSADEFHDVLMDSSSDQDCSDDAEIYKCSDNHQMGRFVFHERRELPNVPLFSHNSKASGTIIRQYRSGNTTCVRPSVDGMDLEWYTGGRQQQRILFSKKVLHRSLRLETC